MSEEPIELCCLLRAREGRAEALHAYEDRVLALIEEHGGEVVRRALAATPDQPDEVQLFRFPSQTAVDAYLADDRRTSLATERDAAVARTELFPVRIG